MLFRSQQKVTEQSVEKANEINVQANKLAEQNILLQNEIQQLNQELSHGEEIRQKADAGENYKKEKERLQASLNDFMRKNKTLQDEITELKLTHNDNIITLNDNLLKQNAQIDRLNNYIMQLEQNVPASKLKKIKNNDKIGRAHV